MAATRSVFHGYGAYVATQLGPTLCKWYPDDPASLGWDPKRQIGVDLARSPAAVRAGNLAVADIEVDDHRVYGGLTRIGPDFPRGATIGACWATEAVIRRETGGPPLTPPPTDCRPYELKHVLYWDGPLATNRFQGTYAEIQAVQGTAALCTIWNPGTSLQPNAAPAGTWWIDLAYQHPIEAGFTEIGVGAADKKAGALFLDMHVVRTLPLDEPKKPPILGADEFPVDPFATIPPSEIVESR